MDREALIRLLCCHNGAQGFCGNVGQHNGCRNGYGELDPNKCKMTSGGYHLSAEARLADVVLEALAKQEPR